MMTKQEPQHEDRKIRRTLGKAYCSLSGCGKKWKEVVIVGKLRTAFCFP